MGGKCAVADVSSGLPACGSSDQMWHYPRELKEEKGLLTAVQSSAFDLKFMLFQVQC